MEMYILKSSACLAIFMVFYKLLLEKESIHTFKRFYLLAALVVSICIPFITFTHYIEPVQSSILLNQFVSQTPSNVLESSTRESVNYLPLILWSIYILGASIFAVRFGINLFKIIKRIKQNPKYKKQSYFHVLLKDLIHPHTFLNYIFLNKTNYESHLIPEEVLLHEETHAKEKHALDILFIELLQIIFWFNPLFHFIKKDIKLNHEFLADKAVLNNGIDSKNYQQLLLAFSSPDSYRDAKVPQLTNAINYSSIKKRFTVMKTHTSKSAIWLRSLILLPLLAILVYSFSTNRIIEKEPQNEVINDNGSYSIKSFISEKQKGASKEQLAEYNALAKAYNSQGKDNQIIKLDDMKRLKYLYDLMTDEQKKVAEPLPNFPPPPPPPAKDMTKAQKKAYDDMSNKARKGESYSYQYKNKDGKIVEVEVGKRDMSVPPPPPPPVPANASPEIKEQYKKAHESYNKKYRVEDGKVLKNPPPPPPPVPANATPKQKAKYKKVSDAYYKKYHVKDGKVSLNAPPPPPPPVSALDHVIGMAKKNATFYYEGKEITSDKAIEIMKSNKDMNISSKNSNTKNPKVYLSKEPITIKN